jgi:hypothetical protein
MKKIVIFAVALLLIANLAAFAQVKVSGSLRYDGRYAFDIDQNDGSLSQTLLNEGTGITASYAGDSVSAFITLSPGNSGYNYVAGADITWHPLSILSLSAGYGRTPVTYWSGIGYQGDGNWGYGAMDISGGRGAYVKVGAAGFQLGILGNGASYTDLPVFFAGYDISPSDGISVGIGGAIAYGSYGQNAKATYAGGAANYDTDGNLDGPGNPTGASIVYNAGKEFDGAASVHASLAFGQASVGLNVGYATGFRVFQNDAFNPTQVKALVKAIHAWDNPNNYADRFKTNGTEQNLNNEGYLEGFVDFEYKINDTLGAGLSAGLVHSLDMDTSALKLQLQIPISTSMGVSVIPGADYTKYFGEAEIDGTFGIGCSIGYAF